MLITNNSANRSKFLEFAKQTPQSHTFTKYKIKKCTCTYTVCSTCSHACDIIIHNIMINIKHKRRKKKSQKISLLMKLLWIKLGSLYLKSRKGKIKCNHTIQTCLLNPSFDPSLFLHFSCSAPSIHLAIINRITKPLTLQLAHKVTAWSLLGFNHTSVSIEVQSLPTHGHNSNMPGCLSY